MVKRDFSKFDMDVRFNLLAPSSTFSISMLESSRFFEIKSLFSLLYVEYLYI